MGAAARSIPNGQHCTHYPGSSKDALATAIDWYKKALPGGNSEKFSLHSLFGSDFKLDGVRLTLGDDFVNQRGRRRSECRSQGSR